jgi:hypothetical protein
MLQGDFESLILECQRLEDDLKNLPTNFRLAGQYMAIEQELENIKELNEEFKNMVNRQRAAIDKRIMRTRLNISILSKRVEKCKINFQES